MLNATNIPCHLSLNTNGEDVFNSVVLPRSERLSNNMPENVIPLPLDVVTTTLYEMYIWVKNTNTDEKQRTKLPTFKRSKKRGLVKAEEVSLPLSMYQNVSLRFCSISSLEVGEDPADPSSSEQQLFVLQSNIAFR